MTKDSKTAGNADAPADQIGADQFFAVDMRVGRITAVSDFERARNPSYRLDIDFGPLGTRRSSAQITSYDHADLIGRKIIAAVNLPPRNIAGFQSEVLVLGTADPTGRIRLLRPSDSAEPGTRVH